MFGQAGPEQAYECGKKAKQSVKLWTPTFVLLIFLGTLTSIGFNMVSPTLTKYAVGLGASLELAGFLSGMFSITALIARPLSGVIADRLNKKKLLIFATILIGLAAAGYSFSHTISVLIAFRILHGIAFAISSTTTVTLLAAVLPRKHLGEGIGYYGIGHILATAFGPGIGLAIGEGFGLQTTYLVSALLSLFAAAVMSRIKYSEKPVVKQRRKILLSDLLSLKILHFALIGGLFSLLNGVISSFIILLSDERQIQGIGTVFALSAVVLFLIRPFAGRLSDRQNISLILIPALIMSAVAAFIIGAANSLWLILVATVLRSVAQGAAQPSLQTACLRALPANESGVASSTFYLGADLGQGLGPVIGGIISSSWGYDVMFYCCAGLFILGLVLWLLGLLPARIAKATCES